MENKLNITKPNSIVGNWIGKVKQIMLGQEVEIVVNMDLRQQNDKITGTARLDVSHIHLKDDSGKPLEPATLTIEGSFYENRFLRLDYKNPKEPLQFGYIVIDLFENSIKADNHTIK